MSDYFGLDIGSNNIKVAQVNGRTVSLGSVANPVGRTGFDLVPGEKQKLVEAVKKLMSESNIKTEKVVVSVPEGLVYSKVMTFPVISSAELATAIKWQAEQDVPLPPEQFQLSWVIIDKPIKKTGNEVMKVIVVATPKKVTDSLVDLLSLIGLEPVRAENETLSLVRLLVENQGQKGTLLLCDIGSSSMKMILTVNNEIKMIYTSSVGGMALTRALAQEFSLSMIQAEQYKKAYGLDKTQLEGRLYRAMEPVVNSILDEFSKAVGGYNQKNPDNRVERVILTGGGTYLKGLLGFISERLATEVLVADSFMNYSVDKNQVGFGAMYAVSMGLAVEDKT